MAESNEFEDWLATRPKIIQDLGRRCPPGDYKMTAHAPYGITCPGTIVSVIGYNENGWVLVAIKPEDMRPEAIEHINRILHPQGRDYEEMKDAPHTATVEPQYLLPHNRTTT